MTNDGKLYPISVRAIDHVAFNVRDLEKSLEFYTKVIGLKITKREVSKPGIEYFLDCGPSLLGLIQAKDFDNSPVFTNEGLGTNHFSFRIDARDFETMIGLLEARHVKIEFAKKRPKSWSLYFYDVDGNKLEATAWPLQDGLPQDQRVNAIYDSQTKTWKTY